MYDIVIVGAGTAGLSAAIYAVRAGKSVLVLEAITYGGQIVTSPEVENYPGISHISGYEFAKNLYEQAMGLGAEYKQEKVVRIEDKSTYKCVYTQQTISGKSAEYEAKAVILCTGAKNRQLGVAAEESFIGAGLSYCATCDGMFFRGKEVAVVGGGNTALEDALHLSGYCKKVYLIHRRQEFCGDEKTADILRKKINVELVLDTIVTALFGETVLEGITIQNVATKVEKTLKLDGVFVAIGQMPDNDSFTNIITTDEKGYIQASEDCKTITPGIYTAGDCRTKQVRQLTTAASDGAVAALAACEYLT